MIQEFFINEIVETIEQDDLYSIMNKRMINTKTLCSDEYNAGPPDICYIVREISQKGFFKGKKSNKIGGYHYVYGLDTSNVAYISAYISQYIQKYHSLYKEGLNNAANVVNMVNGVNLALSKITQSIFCAYDIFSEKDLRILIKFPGGIRKIFYIDDSQATEANPNELRTVFLSSMVRSWCYSDSPPTSNCIFLEEFSNTKTFDYLAESIIYIINEKAEYKFPNFEKKLDLVLNWFVHYLVSTRRFSFAVTFFSKLTYVDSSLAKYVLKPLEILECFEDSLHFIATLLLSTASPMLICYEINLLTKLRKFEHALELAKFVTSINPELPDAWVALADLYLSQHRYESCLKALNNIYFLREFNSSAEDIKKSMSVVNGITINEIPVQKLKVTKNQINIKITDLLYCSKKYVDLYYSSSQFYLCENSDVLQDTINKILSCPYFSFDKTQKKCYSILLEMIKEINFDTFIDLKSKIFCENNIKLNNNKGNGNDDSSDSNDKFKDDKGTLKISINPFFKIILNNLVEDLKIFSVVISQEDNYFQSLVSKDELAIAEVKFCISFAIISERLKYYHTALKYYYKALKFCFSKYVFARVVIINSKLKDFKTAITSIGELLECFPQENFCFINKTPLWIDKIVLKVLFEYQASEILQWLNDESKQVNDFFKGIINKYKYWVEMGHELHLIK